MHDYNGAEIIINEIKQEIVVKMPDDKVYRYEFDYVPMLDDLMHVYELIDGANETKAI